MAKGGKGKFKIANPQEQLDKVKIDKYKIGEKGVSFYDIREMKPVFAFDYLSLNSSDLCYDCSTLTLEDYLGLLTALKTNSQFTYNDLRVNKYYRFHPINFDEDNISIKRKDFKKALSFKPDEIPDDELPTLYQFDLHYHQKARACGFLYKGIFYLVWFDRNHIIYPGGK
ncbi:hypothetical protein ACL9RF_17490 [Sphingobacterium sp. Mn56C]|uniref:hypothetical protein n=1 Tax=Sphingobacterium sp. Mn56C TaxID=3395261 RepID=UPI003BE5B188